MKKMKMAFIISLVTVIVLGITIGYAYAEPSSVPSTGTFSGSYVSIESDTNGDGIKASLFTGAGDDSVSGKFTSQSVIELYVSGDKNCPNSSPGIEMTMVPGTGAFVNRYESGELVYGVYIAQTQCFDPITKTVFYNYTTKFTGGTGGHVGVTGTSEGQGNSTLLNQDLTGNVFGAASGQYRSTLILPADN